MAEYFANYFKNISTEFPPPPPNSSPNSITSDSIFLLSIDDKTNSSSKKILFYFLIINILKSLTINLPIKIFFKGLPIQSLLYEEK
jgi:hypothetical protein